MLARAADVKVVANDIFMDALTTHALAQTKSHRSAQVLQAIHRLLLSGAEFCSNKGAEALAILHRSHDPSPILCQTMHATSMTVFPADYRSLTILSACFLGSGIRLRRRDSPSIYPVSSSWSRRRTFESSCPSIHGYSPLDAMPLCMLS